MEIAKQQHGKHEEKYEGVGNWGTFDFLAILKILKLKIIQENFIIF